MNKERKSPSEIVKEICTPSFSGAVFINDAQHIKDVEQALTTERQETERFMQEFNTLRATVVDLERNNNGMSGWIDHHKPKLKQLKEQIERLTDEIERLKAK